MKKSIAVLLTITFCASLSSAAPPLPQPSSLPACATIDIACIKHSLYVRNEEAKSFAREAGLLRLQLDTVEQVAATLKLDNATIRAASAAVLEASKTAVGQRLWIETPSFLVPLGVVLGVALTVFAVWAVGRLQDSLTRPAS